MELNEFAEITSIKDIKNVFYINLKHRTDRKKHVEEQLTSVGLTNFNRFDAIYMENGAIGCSSSHLQLLEMALENKMDHILIVEDDITFLNPTLFVNQLNAFFSNRNKNKNDNNKWDVVLFAGNNVPPYDVMDNTCIRVKRCQTTTGYLVNGHYVSTLMNNVKIGLSHLFKKPTEHRVYAIDKFWQLLQPLHKWYLITPPTVVQYAGYSDIQRRDTNFEKAMTDLDKPYLFNRPNPL